MTRHWFDQLFSISVRRARIFFKRCVEFTWYSDQQEEIWYQSTLYFYYAFPIVNIAKNQDLGHAGCTVLNWMESSITSILYCTKALKGQKTLQIWSKGGTYVPIRIVNFPWTKQLKNGHRFYSKMPILTSAVESVELHNSDNSGYLYINKIGFHHIFKTEDNLKLSKCGKRLKLVLDWVPIVLKLEESFPSDVRQQNNEGQWSISVEQLPFTAANRTRQLWRTIGW